jgi:hypothetical protein
MTRVVYPAAVLDQYVFGLGKVIPPVFEFVCDLDLPRHQYIITQG